MPGGEQAVHQRRDRGRCQIEAGAQLSGGHRSALLLGLMVADLVLVMAWCVPVLLLGFLVGVEFVTGVAGVLAFIVIAGLWGLAFTGSPYAITLQTGSPAAVNAAFLLFFPFAFLTTSFLPQDALTGWLATIADYNPITYLLATLKSLISDGWVWDDLWPGLLAIAVVGAASFTLAFATLRGRVSRD
ncbi:ABC transporter permease [Arthrobacter pityocampae]|uniref:ABC transporter permease n=1 Tax=Arthrobacter pityocampae TaxID=547334 RepID=UPI003735AA24